MKKKSRKFYVRVFSYVLLYRRRSVQVYCMRPSDISGTALMLVRLLQEDAFMLFHKQTLIHKKEIAKVSRKRVFSYVLL